MANKHVEISSEAIRKALNKFRPEQAIAEYIWNGFDAKATRVEITYTERLNSLGLIESICIEDNGEGIIHDELDLKFKKFNESQKAKKKKRSHDLTKGKNGYGRFTFFKFANQASWETVYRKQDSLYNYTIQIKNETLNDYQHSEAVLDNDKQPGTKVTFTDINHNFSTDFIKKILIPHLCTSFAWYIEVNPNYEIVINGAKLDYSEIITAKESFVCEIENHAIQCIYIQWAKKLEDQYSHFYFIAEDDVLKVKQTTLLNKKGDNFWHSIIIKNPLFNNIYIPNSLDSEDTESHLFEKPEDKKVFKKLVEKLNEYLKQKRKPFLRNQSEILITKYEEEKVMPKFGKEEWEQVRKESFENLIKGIYEAEPAIFLKLNLSQKRIFLELLNLMMDSSGRDDLFKILESIVDLDSDERERFAKVLESTKLEYIISTIETIQGRIAALEGLKELVFNHELKANERDHLQKFIENNYWIFGEEYRLICSEEVKFEQALKKYLHYLRGSEEKHAIDHPDKNKEMDLFLSGKDFRDGKPHNIVIEIKNPTTIKRLTSKELTQIKTYIDVILKQDQFNSEHEFWSFFLIGQDYDDIVKEDIRNPLNGLVREKDNYCLFVRKWSDIILEAENRFRYLLEKMKIKRSELLSAATAKDIVAITSKSIYLS